MYKYLCVKTCYLIINASLCSSGSFSCSTKVLHHRSYFGSYGANHLSFFLRQCRRTCIPFFFIAIVAMAC
ncbi:hypothetical protein VNO77_03154 [Canavalia gladiata]|uniref:Uncharacterized protein n=1 Tax=Canavalia gladiata TaxID=3824 RepID=A0AAN9R3K8_CANGL